MKYVFVLVLFLSLGTGIVFANDPALPDYKNWPKSLPTTSSVSFQGVVFEANVTIYFNNELPREASEIVADFSMTINSETQHYVQYVIVQAKDVPTNMVTLNAELFQTDRDKMLFRGTVKVTMPIKEFHKNILLLPEVPAATEYDYLEY